MSTPTPMGDFPQPPLIPPNKKLSTSLIIGIITLFVVLLLVISGIVYFASGGSGSAVTPGTTPTTAPTQGTTPTTVPTAFNIASVTMAVNPQSIAGMACGTPITVVYTATFQAAPNSPGGTTQFTYNTDNGRASTPGSLTFAPGETTKTFTFNWSGTLLADHTFPEAGGVNVTSPNVVNSPLLGPTGTCTQQSAFQVTTMTMTANPTTISNLHCGVPATIFYTATFNAPANSPGSTIQFAYGVQDGTNKATTPASITLASGQTSKTYSFQWNGAFVAGQAYSAGIATTSPNVVNASLSQPTGTCLP